MSIIRKTASLIGLKALRDLVSDSLAIDMGSANTIIWVRGHGVVVDEPSLVAVHNFTGEIVAFGNEAKAMQGREAREITVIAPLVDGVVADFERTQDLLTHFVKQARSGVSHFSRRAVMSVLSGVTHVEQRALLAAAEQAKIRRVFMMEEGLAAALGSGVKADDRHAAAVVDIGSGTTNIAVIAQGTIVHSRAERLGSSDINLALIDHLRRHRGLTIGDETAERLKLEFASAMPPEDLGRETTVKGRDVQTGGPHAIELTAGEIYPVGQHVVRKIAESVTQTLTELPPEVAADIYDRGIILTGGGAMFDGLDHYLRAETKLPVAIADEPRYAVVRGLSEMFDEPLLLRRVSRNEPHPLIDAVDAGAFEV
jgi:rod shape-determining protein MreB